MKRNCFSLNTLAKAAGLALITSSYPAHASDTATGGASESAIATTTEILAETPLWGFYAAPAPGFVSVPLGTEFTDIQRLNLPAGKYIVNASAVLSSNSPASQEVQCIFMVNGFTRSELASGMIGGTGLNTKTTLAPTAGFRFKNRQTLALACRTEVALSVISQGSPITAIQVDRLNVKTGLGFDPQNP